MAAMLNNALHAAEAFEDYEQHREGSSLPDTTHSTADAGSPLSTAMDKQDGRMKASRSKSRNSLFSRKNPKKDPDAVSPVTPEHPRARETDSSNQTLGEMDRYVAEGYRSRGGNTFASLSIMPEELPELPAWYNQDLEWIAASAIQFRVKFPIHNPVGPKYYKNYHLIPPSELEPSMRPPSVFSPSFPPMTPPEASEDAAWAPGPSRTPSGSPLPTPNSSQVRINETGMRVRTRKTSQTAHDNVDLLDVTDPWGSHWHHESPYDVGMTPSPVAVDAPEGPLKSRSRMSSMSTAPTRHRSVIPSPLSQSTSALHLQPPEANGSVGRRLSKRRRPGIKNFFAGSKDDDNEEARFVVSAPATPVDHPAHGSSHLVPPPANGNARLVRKLSKRGPSLPVNQSPSPTPSARPPSVSTHDTNKKRGSIFGALAKRFTVVRRHPNRRSSVDDSNHGELSAKNNGSPPPERPFMQERRSSGISKRVPPPSLETPHDVQGPASSPPPEPGHRQDEHVHSDRGSVMEAPYSMGKLTIANPDANTASPASPARTEVPLPPEKDVVVSPRHDQQPATVGQILERDEFVSEPEPIQETAQVRDSAHEVVQVSQVAETPSRAVIGSHESSSNSRKEVLAPASAPHSPAIVPVSMAHPSSGRHGDALLPAAQTPSKVREGHPIIVHSHEVRQEEHRPASAAKPEPGAGSSSRPRVLEQDEYLPPPPPISTLPFISTDDSPLSRASIIANPPTPQMPSNAELPEIPNTPGVVPQVVEPIASSSTGMKSAETVRTATQRDTSPTKGKEKSPTKSRQTETFRLVRSPSGTVHPASETIRADGEMWEIVETNDTPHKSRTKERTRSSEQEHLDRKSSRNRERQETVDQRPRASESRERYKSSSGRQDVSPIVVAGPSTSHSRARSVEGSRRPAIPEQLLNQREDRSLGERRERHTSPDKRVSNGRHASPTDVRPHKPAPGNSGVPDVHRRPSQSVPRPTSDVQSVDDFENFRAREAWEMDRLYKGRSWDFDSPKAVLSQATPSVHRDSSRQGHVGRSQTLHSTGHGSSHTSVVVQNSFQASASSPAVYAVPPAPIVYPAHVQSSHRRSPSYDYPNNYRSYQDTVSPPRRSSNSNANPLPEPPREANYQPAPLPAGLSDGPASPEYWNKYAGLTAAH